MPTSRSFRGASEVAVGIATRFGDQAVAAHGLVALA